MNDERRSEANVTGAYGWGDRTSVAGLPKFRFHLLGLAHLPTHWEYSLCAYTQKVIKLARMLKALEHQVIFYGGEGSEVECDEFVQVVTATDRLTCYGDYLREVDYALKKVGAIEWQNISKDA